MNLFAKTSISGSANSDISEKLALNAHALAQTRTDALAMNQQALIRACLETQDDASLLLALRETKTAEAAKCLEKDIQSCCDEVFYQNPAGNKWATTLAIFPIEFEIVNENWSGTLVLPDPDLFLEPLSASGLIAEGETFNFVPRLFGLEELKALKFSEVYAATRWLAPSVAQAPGMSAPAFLTAPPLEVTTDAGFLTAFHPYLLAAFTRPVDSTSMEDARAIINWLDDVDRQWSARVSADVSILNPAMFHHALFMAGNFRRSQRDCMELRMAAGEMRMPLEEIEILASLHIFGSLHLEARLAAYRKGNAQPFYTKAWSIDDPNDAPEQARFLDGMLQAAGFTNISFVDDMITKDKCPCCGLRLFPSPQGPIHTLSGIGNLSLPKSAVKGAAQEIALH